MMASATEGGIPPGPLQALLREVTAQIRRRRAQAGAIRGLFWGSLAAIAVLCAKSLLGDASVYAALAVSACGLLAGTLVASLRRIPPSTAARLADRTLNLSDRLSTALEWSRKEQGSPLIKALVADAAARLEQAGPLSKHRFVAHRWPREGRWLVWPLLAGALLLYLPPVPLPRDLLDQFTADRPREEKSAVSLMDRLKTLSGNLLPRNPFKQEESAAASANDTRSPAEAAEFKDKAMSRSKSDFSSFVKKGDERLRMLERTDSLPDLQSDFATSKYKMLLRKSQELSSGNGPGQLSASKLSQILKEMERLGKKSGGGDWSDEVNEGLEALEQGQTEEAMEAMQNALGKIRDAEDKQRSSKSLRGGPDDTALDREAGSAESGSQSFNDADRRGGYSQAKGGASKGNPTARLRSTPYDSGVQGQRSGRMPSYETQSTGRPGALGMQLQYMGEIGQYRRLMEDAIAREQIPRDYHNQIRDYFKSLGEQ